MAWCIVGEKTTKGIVLPPKPGTDKKRYMPFNPPLHVVEIRGDSWPMSTPSFRLSRSAKGLTVTFSNGEKQSFTPTGARVWMRDRFPGDFARELATACNVL